MAAPERNNSISVFTLVPLKIFFLLSTKKMAITIAANTALNKAISLLERSIRRVKTPIVPNIAIDIENKSFAGYFCFTLSFSYFSLKTGIEFF